MADCAIFILCNGNEALMENRPDLGPGCDPYWVYPGGKVNPGETPEQAMFRECFEEAGVRALSCVKLTDDELWSSPNQHSNPDDPRGWRVFAYVVEEWDGCVPVRSHDKRHAAYAWIDPAEISHEDDGYTCVGALACRLYEDHKYVGES